MKTIIPAIVLLFVPLSGCESSSPRAPLAVAAAAPASEAQDAAIEGLWSPEDRGLQSRLTIAPGVRRLGAPLRLRLELRSVADAPLTYDPQQVDVNEPFIIEGPNGAVAADGMAQRRVPWTAGSVQTVGHGQPIAPGETKVLVADFDIAGHYLMTEPGLYRIQSRRHEGFGDHAIPASSPVTVYLSAGATTPADRLLSAIHRELPERWDVNRRGVNRGAGHTAGPASDPADEVYVSFYPPSGLKSEVLTAGIAFFETQPAEPAAAMEYWGHHALGEAYIFIGPGAAEQWPGCRAALAAALGR